MGTIRPLKGTKELKIQIIRNFTIQKNLWLLFNAKFWVDTIIKVLCPSISSRNFSPISPPTHFEGGWIFWCRANFYEKSHGRFFFWNSKIVHFFLNKVWNLPIADLSFLVVFRSKKFRINPCQFFWWNDFKIFNPNQIVWIA